MSKRTLTIGALAAVALLAAGGLFASNMGFKLNYELADAATQGGGSATGINTIGLPFNRQSGIDTAQQLMTDIGSANVQNMQRYLQSSNGLELVSPGSGDFSLAAGEGYFIRMKSGGTTNYIIVGSHDPAASITLAGTGEPVAGGTSAAGTNFFAYPYHSTASNAQQLADDIGSADVQNIQRYVESNNGIEIFSPGGASPFSLVPGEGYLVRIKSGITKNYTPSHY